MSQLLIIGAKGFAKELLECVLQADPACDVTFFDDVSPESNPKLFDRFDILHSENEARDYFERNGPDFALGVGRPHWREELFERFSVLGGTPKKVISPYARIGKFGNNIGNGICILADAVIESDCSIERGALVHTGVFISHDVTVGEFCELSPRATLLGGVRIGNRCRVGAGAIILPTISVGNDAVVGAGAVVTRNVPNGDTVVGVPAKRIRKKNE